MEQNMTLNSTLSEEDKVLDVEQGGCFPWGVYKTPYFSFGFKPRGDRKKYIEELFDIVREIIEYFSKDKVVNFACSYGIKKHKRKPLLKKWIPPEYIEDGKVNEFKQYLINGEIFIFTTYK